MSPDVLWSLTGLVVGGERRGRLIGFPTANVQVSGASSLPPDGIYAGVARSLQHPSVSWAAAISVGSNPTFDGIARTVEAHLLDFTGDLYGQQLQLETVHRLRGMSKFPDLQALVDAITADVAATRALMDDKRSEPSFCPSWDAATVEPPNRGRCPQQETSTSSLRY